MSSTIVQTTVKNGVYTISNGKDAIVVGNIQDANLAADFMADGQRPSVIRALLG